MFNKTLQETELFLDAICNMVEFEEAVDEFSERLLDDAAELALRNMNAPRTDFSDLEIQTFRNRVVYRLVSEIQKSETREPSEQWFIDEIDRLARARECA